MQDVRVFNAEKKELKYARNSGEIIEPKTNHASTILGKFLLVHGGINNRN